MLKLPHIFSSGALFLQNAPLTVCGFADAGTEVCAALTGEGGMCFSSAVGAADDTGAFALTLSAPPGSDRAWRMTVAAGAERHVMEDVLFGELWLASGQSNMELENAKQPDCDAFLQTLSDCTLRVYHVYNIDGGSAGMFPEEPDSMARGAWFSVGDRAGAELISAVGSAFAGELSALLRTHGRGVPIGFVNACWGGTGIRSWIPRTAIDAEAALCRRLRSAGFYTDPDKWNTHGRDNAQQLSCQYNLKIHGLRGVRFRGMLWYQGEFECWDEPRLGLYRDCLALLHRTYRALFAADSRFPMLCVLIYPFPCTDEGDCYIGYVNQNFVDAAGEDPEEFHCMPIYDLPPVWQFPDNHPIHPLHKYPVGRRLGRMAGAAVYGFDGQKNPAVLTQWEREGSRLLLHFAVPGQTDALRQYGGIRIGEGVLRDPVRTGTPIGLYVCGASGVYVPAFCEILSEDTLAVSHPGIDVPEHAAYAYSSMEEGCNLYAGEYPLAPFCTDDRRTHSDGSDALIRIECKPWCDPTRTAVWTTCEHDGVLDVFYRPVWQANPGCCVVHDRAFTLDRGSIRIAHAGTELQRKSVIGAYVVAYPYNRLDLQNYSALRFRMLNGAHASVSVILHGASPDGTSFACRLCAEKTAELHHAWAEYAVCFDGIPAGEIRRLEFCAELTDTYYHFVNLEGFVLMPRGA